MPKQIKGTALILFAAMIWGASFVAQSVGVRQIGPFTFQAVRQILGFLVLIPVILIRDKRMGDASPRPRTKAEKTRLLRSGAICGLLLFLAGISQQFGLLTLTAGKSGFITAMYVILIPIFGIFLGKKPRAAVAVAAGLSLLGLYLLCVDGPLALGTGELLTLLCAVLFAFHMMYIDHVIEGQDALRMSALQFLFCGLYSIPFMFLVETPSIPAILDCWLPIGYTGIFSCAVGFTLQMVAQTMVDPTILSIAMSTESLFSAVFGWLLLQEVIPPKGLIGCAMMFLGVLLAQIPGRKKS